tara:strand:- start:1049 stop:1435 length:387 start_codon:yes stop_codon:yes gene_type:complete
MIKNVQSDDGLEEVKEKLNEVIKVIVWDNPTATVEKIAVKHLSKHNRQIATTRDELKSTLVEVKTANKNAEGCRDDVVNFIKETEEKISSFEKTINNELEEVKDTMKQFITFYAQVGLHVKELCDGKK